MYFARELVYAQRRVSKIFSDMMVTCTCVLGVQNMVHHSAGPFRWQPDEPTRLWVLDRKANTSDGIRCFTIDTAMNFMHTAAAFEVGSTILLYATVQTEVSLLPFREWTPEAANVDKCALGAHCKDHHPLERMQS